MTKIKNTKKGMAKKTLSISLAVAMLATSNVPVWAAEFTDGTDAAFTSEAPAEVETPAEEVITDTEAPVVDEETNVDNAKEDAPTVDSQYVVEFKDLPSSMEWDEIKTVGVRVYDAINEKYVTDSDKLKIRYCDEDGQLEGDYGQEFEVTSASTADGWGSFSINFKEWVKKNHSFVGKKFRLQLLNTNDDNETGYAEPSAPITLEKVTISGTVDVTGKNAGKTWYKNWNQVVYNGKPIEQGPTFATSASWTNTGINWTKHGLMTEDKAFYLTGTLDTKDCEIHGHDITNAYNHSKEILTATNRIDDPLYRGEVTTTFAIEPKLITESNFDENIKVSLPYYNFEYTGGKIVIPVEKASVTDLNSGLTVKDAFDTTKNSSIWISDAAVTALGVYNDDVHKPSTYVKAWLSESALDNFVFESNVDMLRRVDGTVTVSARDLANTVNTSISFRKVNNEALNNGSFVSADGLMNNIKVVDVQTGEDITNSLKKELKITFAGKDELSVKVGKTYTATVSSDSDKNKNVINSRDVDFRVIGHDLEAAEVEKEAELSRDATYTGSQITKNITADNFEEKVGVIRYYEDSTNGRILVKGQEYSTTPEFGENLNAVYSHATNTSVGKGYIYINGVGTFEGTQREISFNIKPRKADTLKVPASIPFDEKFETADDYDMLSQTSVTATFKDEWTGEDKELTVPTEDYTVTYEFLEADKKTVSKYPVKGGYIKTTVKQKHTGTSNFDLENAPEGKNIQAVENQVGYTKLVKKVITAENVILNKDSYVYTGKDIVVDYKVVYNGVTLEKGKDYEEKLVNGVNVGENTYLVITGKGDYDDTPVKVKFQITPANVSDLTVVYDATYDGTSHKDADKVTLKLGDVTVTNQIKVTFPYSATANINAGNGDITLAPKKDNKNFVGTVDKTFTIKPAQLNDGELKSYNDKESLVKWYNGNQDKEFRFTYDGSEKTYKKNIYKATKQDGKKVVTDSDWEVKYADNVHGLMTYKEGNAGRAFALVVAKGNYANASYNLSVDGTEVVKDGVYTCEDGTKITNVVKAEAFLIDHLEIHKSNVKVENGQYKGGLKVEPVVTINYNGKNLVKGDDFELKFDDNTEAKRTEITNGKTLDVEIVGKGGYYLANDLKDVKFAWGIDKFDLANAEYVVKGTDADPQITVINNGKVVDPSNYDVVAADGKVTVTAKKESKQYTGTKTLDIKHELDKPETPTLVDPVVMVNGNTVKVSLASDCEDAVGYDYVISKDIDCITNKKYDKVNKNQLTDTTFQYVEPGTYYAYCHAWKRNEETNKKDFSDWSAPVKFTVTAVTPETPVITSVKVKGSTVTVTYKESSYADGYDVVLGGKLATVLSEKRPVEYGKLVKKNQTKTTVVFKNVPKGTYYPGAHAYNRKTSDGKKVFSPWANWNQKIVVK